MVSESIRLAYALLFGAAAAHKLRDLAAFHTALAGYAILPARAVWAAAIAVPGSEAAIAVALAAGHAVEIAATAGIALLATYAAAIAVNLRRGRRTIACGCGGFAGERPITAGLVARNAVLLSGLAVLLLPRTPRSLGWLDWASACFALVASALLYAAADLALANAVRLRQWQGEPTR
jgi:hypothetical protein